MAEDKQEAAKITPDHISNCSVFAWEAKSVDADWWDAIPYNADGDKTCGQILDEMKEGV